MLPQVPHLVSVGAANFMFDALRLAALDLEVLYLGVAILLTSLSIFELH